MSSERRLGLSIPAIQVSARCAFAAAVALGIANALDMLFPIYAVIAAVIVTDPSAVETRNQSIPRLLGTIVGATLGAVLSPWLAAGPAAIAIGIFVAMALSHGVGMPSAAKLAGYVCAICLLQETAAPWTYAWWRFAETALGIGVAVLASLVPPLLPSSSTQEETS